MRVGAHAPGWAGVLLWGAAACGIPATREQFTVYEAPALVPASPAEETPPPTAAPPETAERHVVADWIEPLRARDLAPLAERLAPESVMTVERSAGAGHTTRTGPEAILGWLRGHVLATPYVAVRERYLGATAREGEGLCDLELLDACDGVLLHLVAKVRVEGQRFVRVQLRVARPVPPPCSP